MKFILSRKGMDSAAGGFANPILPDGTLLSLPIPDESTDIRYSDLDYYGKGYHKIISEIKGDIIKLENKKITLDRKTTCHFDPDIRKDASIRASSWKGIFGQMGAAQSHLNNKNVDVGDVFLFFGWFRRTIEIDGKLRFDPADKNGRHIIYGYMEIGEINKADDASKIEPWMKYHPHAEKTHLQGTGNTIYLPSRKLSLDDRLGGFGVFDYSDSLVLTKSGYSRSKWDLPELFKNVNMSYHTEKSWKEDYFKSTDRGQEFVIENNDLVTDWARELIRNNSLNICEEKYREIPIRDIINISRADGAIDAVNIIQDNLIDYLDDYGINPEDVGSEVRELVGIIFQSAKNIIDESNEMLDETYKFNFDIEDMNLRVPTDKIIIDNPEDTMTIIDK
jgi:hypothetical protein